MINSKWLAVLAATLHLTTQMGFHTEILAAAVTLLAAIAEARKQE